MNLIAVMTTTDSPDDARSIASALVDRRLAACVHISRIESVYRWQDKIQSDREYRLFIKTTADRYEDVEATILELHRYDLPAVIAVDISRAHVPFAEWVRDNATGERMTAKSETDDA